MAERPVHRHPHHGGHHGKRRVLTPFRHRGGHHLITAKRRVLARFRRRGGHHLITAKRRVVRPLPPPRRTSSHHSKAVSARPLPPPRRTSSHHSGAASARPLPPTRRSIDSSEPGGHCSPATANEAEHRLITAKWPVLARYRQRGGASTHHSEMASAGPLPPTRRSINSSQRGGHCPPTTANEAEHRLITARWPVLARYRQRGGASTHHSEAVSAGPLPPTRRSIDSSQRDGQCWPATTNEAEHHLITAARPMSARFSRRHT
jgi:hypothetical protein